ncbi:PREDICTED: nucleolar protein of 40 kDa [Gekko japonicus]|uniref:Nucleolar protein of 40 kDa n=1 Tax=Gekko japonicus TaxID=146911 RepID=A0ABM1K0E0_GEKJA|nr:PREDICTED: nucleolar protein of 40 kDa [Gekko japonicus]XP_015267177.1 PREDICTED: nucleolar protein of 40 kDa [Gekko japonicus]
MEELPELYDIFQGEVAAVTEYGAFIKIPGCRKQGLVHKSHMSSCRIDKPSEMVDVGEKVWVKLIGKEMKDDKLKLSLSMKVVNQGTGKDLDPNNVALDQDARKKRSFKDYSSQKITLEAVLNTVCKKCGCPGHFAKECFMQPGGIKYGLVPEEEEDIHPEEEKKTHQSEHSAKKRKKEKKKKRKHKSKIPSESDHSDSCNSDAGGDQPSKKKAKHTEKASASQKRKKKKHHKKKHKE